ncbi:MAG: pyruvate dehydrogenase (acetyl-transferring) E1 component subunit alpha [Phycisphaerales bacterium]|nr:pyruvate dehydrogenase (acetyl-transferring) E1 component subunit alpha [PVC group bacterium]MBL6998170.1 pyruvate dehydrogenase (acetyl-transferring) E1 component subunit alpha [Phycisphaerales bacterium]
MDKLDTDIEKASLKPSRTQFVEAALPETGVLLGWLRQMLLIREFEVRTMQAYQNRMIGGFCHVCIGQEAVPVGTIAAVNPDDPVVLAYRCHGHALARGMDPKNCMAEMFGRIGGCAKGKGGSMHMFDAPNFLYGGHGIVGAQTPLGVGLAFATKYEDEVLTEGKSSRLTLCYLGDGALNQGVFYEAMNLAGLYDLPVIFVLENNRYSMGTSIERGTTMANDLRTKSAAFGIDHAIIDGKDVVSLYKSFKPIADWCRTESRPYFVEAKTYRYKGHSMSDPRKYRTKEEEAFEESNDSIDRFEKFLCDEHGITSDGIKQMTRQVKSQVREAVLWARDSEETSIDEMYTDVFTDNWGPFKGTSKPQMMQGNEE